jgi:hypothetical protein
VKERPTENAPKDHQDAEDAEIRRSKDLGERQKMEADDHRTPVGREVGAMESIRQNRNQYDCDGFYERDE